MPLSRRRFIKHCAALAAASALGTRSAQAGGDFHGRPDAWGVLHDIYLCIGCRSCEEGCNLAHNLPQPDKPFKDTSVFEHKRRTTPRAFTVVNRHDVGPSEEKPETYVKTQCNHCIEPACASSCFVKALNVTPEGAVTYDASVCVGCRYCMVSCPFDIPTYEYDEPLTPRVRKCNMCYDRIREGRLPGCVEVCPVQSLVFGRREDLLQVARERIRQHPDIYVNHIYGEHEVGGTHWLYISHIPFEQLGFRMDLGSKPAPEYTKGFLGAVPLVDILLPGFLIGAWAMTRENHDGGGGDGGARHATPDDRHRPESG
ncbi:MAG: 4Fe-4S dicluster domain-containing protein [Candidatus Sumerlaeia bacterium]